MTNRAQTNNICIYIQTNIKIVLLFHWHGMMPFHIWLHCRCRNKSNMSRVHFALILSKFKCLFFYYSVSSPFHSFNANAFFNRNCKIKNRRSFSCLCKFYSLCKSNIIIQSCTIHSSPTFIFFHKIRLLI